MQDSCAYFGAYFAMVMLLTSPMMTFWLLLAYLPLLNFYDFNVFGIWALCSDVTIWSNGGS